MTDLRMISMALAGATHIRTGSRAAPTLITVWIGLTARGRLVI